jgi:excisionase family DNA binding protein
MYTNYSQNNKTTSINELFMDLTLKNLETSEKLQILKQKINDLENKKEINLIPSNEYKEVMNLKDVAKYTGLSTSTIYKKTMNREIPHYKVSKTLFFKFEEIKKWLLSNKVETAFEIRKKII